MRRRLVKGMFDPQPDSLHLDRFDRDSSDVEIGIVLAQLVATAMLLPVLDAGVLGAGSWRFPASW